MFRHLLFGVLYAEAGEANGAGGGAAAGQAQGAEKPQPKYTDDDLNGIVARERRKLETKFADYESVKAQASEAAELKKQIAELSEKLELTGKTESEKQKLIAEKLEQQRRSEVEKISAERDQAKSAAEAAAKALLDTKKEYQVTQALTAAKALPSMLPYAIRAFIDEVEIELDEKGKVTGATVDGVPKKDLNEAAVAWLKNRDGFAQAPQGGGGTRGSNGSGIPNDWRDLPADEIGILAWNTPPTSRG